jgi:hypothetical protein
LGCGFQRAVILMLKGELIQAFCMYPAVYLVILFCGMLFVQTVFKRKYNFKFVAITALTTWIFVLGGYIFKNL